MAWFFIPSRKKIFFGLFFFFSCFGFFSKALAYQDDSANWVNDRVYSISDTIGWIARHHLNGVCDLALIVYQTKKQAVFQSMPIEFISNKNGVFIRSINRVKALHLKPDQEVKIRLRLGQSKYLLPMIAEIDPDIVTAELETSQMKLLLELLYDSQSLSLQFPSDTKPSYYPLYQIRPLIRSFRNCVYVNGFQDLE